MVMDDLHPWLALLRIPGLGPVHYRALLSRYGDPRRVFEQLPRDDEARAALPARARRAILRPDWRAAEADARWDERADGHVLTLADARYPALLGQIHDAPPVLFVWGEPDALSARQIAVVGSRNPTPVGAEAAHGFAAELARAGIVVTSGLATGIDAAAHRGALEAGGRTVAVAATGLDCVYPPGHEGLARLISRQGALVSEFPPGSRPLPESFPRRNRLISGLSLGTLVVEAALRSGSLITARAALEQGREVFAMPGSIHNARARGCHLLIREGAKLVECVRDILEEIEPLCPVASPPAAPGGTPPASPRAAAVLDSIDFAPTTVDTLVERTGIAAERLHELLLELEMDGRIVAGGGGYVRRS
jgi:DNA processing protein